MFGTIIPTTQVSKVMTFFWAYFLIMFGTFIIIKLSIAIVEEGYLTQKFKRKFDWLFIEDVENQTQV